MSRPVSDDAPVDLELHARLDGQLAPAEEAALLRRLDGDREARERLDDYARHKELLRDAAAALDPGVVNLRTAALERDLAARLERAARAAPVRGVSRSWSARAWMARAAAAALLVGAGWFGHAGYLRMSDPLPAYVATATGAHGVFGEDRVRPAEFTAATVSQAQDWLSAKLGRTVPVPALDALGVKLVGARLLGTEAGALAQFIYEDGSGHRLSLVMAPHPADKPAHGVVLASAGAGPTDHWSVGYWSDGALDYALVAKTSPHQLRALATEVSKAAAPRTAANERKT